MRPANRVPAGIAALALVLVAFGDVVAQPAPRSADPSATKAAEPGKRPLLPAVVPTLVFTVDVRWVGASSYRIEHEVTTRIEQSVRTLPGVKAVRSTVVGSRAQTQIVFDARSDVSSTASAVRSRIDQIKTRLPRDASRPLIAWHREPPV